jgi:cell division protein FtsQ
VRPLIPLLRRPATPPAAPVAAEAPAPVRRPLPPGAAMWRVTAPRGTPAEDSPAPVWRSARPLRRPPVGATAAAALSAPAETRPADAMPAPDVPCRAAEDPHAPLPDGAAPDARAASAMARRREVPAAAMPVVVPDPADAPASAGQDAPLPGDVPEAPMTAAEPPAESWRARRRQARRRVDPAPSRTAYRLHRLWLTPMVRVMVRVGLPAWLLAMGVGLVVSDPERRAALAGVWTELREGLETRPEFQVTGLAIEGASPPVVAALNAMAPQDWPVSSFRIDVEALRLGFEALDAVARADLRVRADGVLEARIAERVPAAIWHDGSGLALVDADGHRVARLLARAGRPDLPLIAGIGAERAVPEALALFAAAAPLDEILIGLVRVGERRWDVVLEDDRRIMLPESGALAALERVLAQDQAEDLLARDVVAVDMRLPDRPTLRLSGTAIDEVRRVRAPGSERAMR